MRAAIAITLLACVVQAHPELQTAQDAVSQMVDEAPGRRLSMVPRTNTRSLLLPQPRPTFGGDLSASRPLGYRPVASSMQDDAVAGGGSGGSIGESSTMLNRRNVVNGLTAGVASLMLPLERPARAVQGYTAGRIPGLGPSEVEGFDRYTRPEGKQGGHGIGWSEIPPYTFLLPQEGGWEEVPVSIADLGGTEVDARWKSAKQGDIGVVLAPVLRFSDVGFGADVRIDELGTPEKLIKGFGPEIMQRNVDDLVESTNVRKTGGLTYYDYELSGHTLITMTAQGNRVFIIFIRAQNSQQWKRHQDEFRTIASSFKSTQSPVALSAVEPGSLPIQLFSPGLVASAAVMIVSIGLMKLLKIQTPVESSQEPLIQA